MDNEQVVNWLAERSTEAADVLVDAAAAYSFMITMVPDTDIPDQRLVDATLALQAASREYLALCDLLIAAKGNTPPINGNGARVQ